LTDFFASNEEEKLTFGEEDYFVKQGDDTTVTWLVPTAQKNAMEAIRMEISVGASTEKDLPHEGQEFGYVLEGEIKVAISQEVRLLLGKMNILGGNLWELRKQAHNEGMFNLEIKFKNLANQLEETIEELQSKIS
jgi:hypothetical protein